jgi:hypothetical protein
MELEPATDPVEAHITGSPEPSVTGPDIAPLEYSLSSCSLRFLSSAFSGLFLDIVILCLYGIAVLLGFRPGVMGLFYTLIEVPVILGILGIFFHDEMSGLAEDIASLLPLRRR